MRFVGSRPGFLWQAIILFLILLDSIILFLSIISNLMLNSLHYIALIDLIVSIILFILFIWALIERDKKIIYIKSNWHLIVSFIPFYLIFILNGLLGYVWLIKLLNILKIIGLYFFAQKFSREVLKYQEKTRLVYALAVFLLVLFLCSFIFYLAENGVNPQVISYEDSVWFVLQTITTVGYGDIIPVTGVGRVMGVISMLSALVLTSIVTSVATFSLIEKFRKSTDKLTEQTKEHVENLDNKLDEINNQLKEIDKTKDMKDIKRDLHHLKKDIDDIKDLINRKN